MWYCDFLPVNPHICILFGFSCPQRKLSLVQPFFSDNTVSRRVSTCCLNETSLQCWLVFFWGGASRESFKKSDKKEKISIEDRKSNKQKTCEELPLTSKLKFQN